MNNGRHHEQLQDEVNKLKLENAILRRDLLFVSEEGDEETLKGSDCRVCSVLRFQTKRLTAELAELRLNRSEMPMSAVPELHTVSRMLARERERRIRLESIVSRQQSYINEISERGMLPMSTAGELYMSEFRQPEVYGAYSAVNEWNYSDAQPWDMDIDDLNRQLLELSENVHRVELASSKLTTFSHPIERKQHLPGPFSS